MDAATGAIQHTFKVVPDGCTGGGVWGSPTIDEAKGTLYFNTGNPGSCGTAEPYAESVVELSASDVSQSLGYWNIPAASRVGDGDFGSAMTSFTAKIRGRTRDVVGIQNKNGVYYAFQRDNLSAGPLWQKRIGNGEGCPQCGTSGIAPSAWDGSTLYVGGGRTTINGVSCQGSLQALNPSNGNAKWQLCVPGTILGAVTAVPGLVVAGECCAGSGSPFIVVNSSNGSILFTYPNPSNTRFYGAASIVNGVLYIGDVNGNLYAFAP